MEQVLRSPRILAIGASLQVIASSLRGIRIHLFTRVLHSVAVSRRKAERPWTTSKGLYCDIVRLRESPSSTPKLPPLCVPASTSVHVSISANPAKARILTPFASSASANPLVMRRPPGKIRGNSWTARVCARDEAYRRLAEE